MAAKNPVTTPQHPFVRFIRSLWKDVLAEKNPFVTRGQGFFIGIVLLVPIAILVFGGAFRWIFLVCLGLVALVELGRRRIH